MTRILGPVRTTTSMASPTSRKDRLDSVFQATASDPMYGPQARVDKDIAVGSFNHE